MNRVCLLKIRNGPIEIISYVKHLTKYDRYKKPEERESLNQAMRVLLPLIHQRCLQLMPDQSEAAVAIQKQILKCFYALIQVCVKYLLIKVSNSFNC